MKYLIPVLLMTACVDRYVARFDATPTTTLPANLSTDPISLTEGGIVSSDARLYQNDARTEPRDGDLEVTSTTSGVCKVAKGAKPNSFVFIGVTPGDATIEIRYLGRVVQRRQVRVDAQ